MKFEKVYPHEPWSKEKTEERINVVMGDIRNINKGIETLRGKISNHEHSIRELSKRLSNKQKYINQLQKQLKETSIDIKTNQQ